jgi:hypothetical protein
MDGILNPTADELTRPARHHAPMSDVFRLSWRCGSDHVESAVPPVTEAVAAATWRAYRAASSSRHRRDETCKNVID